MDLKFIMHAIENLEGNDILPRGSYRDTWLPALAEELKGTEFELDS